MRTVAKKILHAAGWSVHRVPAYGFAARERRAYIEAGRIPWGRGYLEYCEEYIRQVLECAEMLALFRHGKPLPPGYGERLDERCIEYPWLFSRLGHDRGPRLDAGSVLNHEWLVAQKEFRAVDWTFVTLAPELECHWKRGISYAFSDLRDLPFRDGYFSEIVCVSTLEHVGMDNRLYAPIAAHGADRPSDFQAALAELRRVLRPGGRLFLTVPFGRYQNWGTFQQFDAILLDRAIDCFQAKSCETNFYRYSKHGWQVSSSDQCCNEEYCRYTANLSRVDKRAGCVIDADFAAAARAVACVVLTKPPAATERRSAGTGALAFSADPHLGRYGAGSEGNAH